LPIRIAVTSIRPSFREAAFRASTGNGGRLRKPIAALIVFFLSATGAVISFEKMSHLRSEAGWLLARADAHGLDYAASLEGGFVDTELATFDQRRTLLERAHRWQRLEIACVLLAAAAAFCGYGVYLLRRAQQHTLEDGMLHR